MIQFSDRIKNSIWDLWERLAIILPGGRGRSLSAHALRRVVGLPIRTVSDVELELFPISSADQWTATHLDSGTAVHEAMRRFLKTEQVFVDVGANIGLFSILAAKNYGATVIAVEPSDRERVRLARNMKYNGVSFRVLPYALGEVDGSALLQMDMQGSHLMNRVAPSQAEGVGAVVHMRRFDSVLGNLDPSKIRLVKIDVEGYEMHVLQGMTSMIDRMCNAIFVVEVTPSWLTDNGSSTDKLYGYFASRGWRSTVGPKDAFQWDEVFLPHSI
jgi:FkbM family methyltransferase